MSQPRPIRIATRGSRLALCQAGVIADLLRNQGRIVELVEVRTTGDRDASAPLSRIGGRGVFTKEVQQAVLDGRADAAVHSLKDLPTEVVSGLQLAAVPPRADPRDALVSSHGNGLDSLPPSARVGTGSSRRAAQLRHRRPDLRIVDVRGNVDTRLRKIKEADLDAIVLAVAGLSRLGLEERITEKLDPTWMVPAVGQGALGIECRRDDPEVARALAGIDDSPSRAAVLAERAFLRHLGGGCLLPIAALATVEHGGIRLRGVVLSADGRQRVAGELTGAAADPELVGQSLAKYLLDRGAAELLSGHV